MNKETPLGIDWGIQALAARDQTDREVLQEVFHERVNQDRKWGQQNWPNGTGPEAAFVTVGTLNGTPIMGMSYDQLAENAKRRTDTAARHGNVTYADILLEEVFEAMAEENPDKLRAELIQVAAVAVAWAEKIDRDKELNNGNE